MAEKRVVPPALKQLLKVDATLTSVFCHTLESIIPPSKSRKYLKGLEISCHGVPWLTVWIALFWILWNPELFEMQINFLFALILDMILVTIVKASARRRRPPGNKPDMFLTIGTDAYSFPSGHVSRAVLISIFFSQLYPTSGLLQLILYVWAMAVSVSRVILKRHFILDVVGGAALGFLESGVVSVFWINKATAAWLITWLSDEHLNLEGLQDGNDVDLEVD